MKIIRFNSLKYIPASHEDKENPEVWKKVLLTYKDLIQGRVQMINWAKLPIGKTFRAHYHEDMQEIFIILKGKAQIKIEQEIEILISGDTVIIPARKIHSMKNIGQEDVEYLVIGIVQGNKGKTITL